tara:strand:+ start:1495 stop:3495 length:2001 start_codon:yes stop_codon:yes gene_type:complete
MLYFDIIIQTLLDIILFDNFLFSFLFFVFFYSIYLLYKKIQVNSSKSIIILLFRFLVILLITPLFNNKIFKDERLSFRSQNIGVMIDNSLSVNKILNTHSIDIQNYLNQIKVWADDKKINLFWYDLDTLINKNNLLFDNESTSFDYLEDISFKNNLDQLILISDGIVNSGFTFNNFYSQDNMIIHTIGLGDLHSKQDIGINNIKIDQALDSINFNVSFSVKANKNSSFIYNIYSDKNVAYSDTIQVSNGEYNFDKKIIFKSKDIGNKISNEIIPLDFSDSKQNNNLWNINLSKNKKNKILMLTGKLNYNTMFIKSNLSSFTNIDLNHQITFDKKNDYSELLKDDFDYVIFDNFPNNDYDYNFFKKLNDKNLKIMFFEGHDFNSDFLIKMLDVISDQNFYIEDKHVSKQLILDNNIDLGYFKSNYNLFCNNCSKFQRINLFSNQSIAELSVSNFYIFLIPNISELSFFMKTKYGSTYIDEYFKYLINKNLNNNSILDFYIYKNNYLMGEKILFKLNQNIPFDIIDKKIIIKNLDSMEIDSVDFNSKNDLFFNQDGQFEIYFSFTGTNLEIINSNKEILFINNYNIELEESMQNIELLNNMASETDGFYTSINNLDLNFLERINSELIEEKLNNIYSALEIFIKEKIFWIIIMFFCVEIYLRKKIGLL